MGHFLAVCASLDDLFISFMHALSKAVDDTIMIACTLSGSHARVLPHMRISTHTRMGCPIWPYMRILIWDAHTRMGQYGEKHMHTAIYLKNAHDVMNPYKTHSRMCQFHALIKHASYGYCMHGEYINAHTHTTIYDVISCSAKIQ